MKKKLIIIGASGHGKVCADIASRMNLWETISFLDDDPLKKNTIGFDVIGISSDAYLYIESAEIFIAIGKNSTRQSIQIDLEIRGAKIPTLIHPNAVIGTDVTVGMGSVIMGGVVINASTRIGKGCIVNTSAIIDHDDSLGDFVHIAPGSKLAGFVNIGDKTWIGIGTTIIQNISIANDCLVGAGSLVTKNISKQGLYFGSPVKLIENVNMDEFL